MSTERTFGVPGHCFSIDNDWWHEPGKCRDPHMRPCCGFEKIDEETASAVLADDFATKLAAVNGYFEKAGMVSRSELTCDSDWSAEHANAYVALRNFWPEVVQELARLRAKEQA